MLSLTEDNGIATIVMDDGKVNAFERLAFERLDSALDDCVDARGLVIAGREGMFSGGLHRGALAELDDDGLTDLLVAFGRTFLRVWLEPRPVVAAATGHAVAAGTALAMTCDHVVAADGDFRWGMTETTIGFVLPRWIIALTRANVRADRVEGLLLSGRTVTTAQALEVGFADELVPPAQVIDVAKERARGLAELPAPTYAAQKRRLRGATVDALLDDIVADTRQALASRQPREGEPA